MIAQAHKPMTMQQELLHLYEQAFPKVAAFVRKSGGSFEDARDIFHDALIIFWEKKNGSTEAVINDELQYISGISKHLWYRRFRNAIETDIPEDYLLYNIPDEQEPEVSSNLLQYIELSGKRCLELLKAFYYDKLSMKAIAGSLGFSGERSATVQKYKCLEKVREAVKERALNKEDFYD